MAGPHGRAARQSRSPGKRPALRVSAHVGLVQRFLNLILDPTRRLVSAPAPRWDIFCTVVDNYGDVGVAWRLARQLAGEHAIAVRLFVDDMRALARLAPEIDAATSEQRARGVDVCRWG